MDPQKTHTMYETNKGPWNWAIRKGQSSSNHPIFRGYVFFQGMDPANMVPMASYDTYGLSDLVTGGVGHWRMGWRESLCGPVGVLSRRNYIFYWIDQVGFENILMELFWLMLLVFSQPMAACKISGNKKIQKWVKHPNCWYSIHHQLAHYLAPKVACRHLFWLWSFDLWWCLTKLQA